MTGLLFYGDPHGEWRPLLHEVRGAVGRGYPPAAVILIGDCDLEVPLREAIQPVFRNRIPVFWIHGNHDVDKEHWWLNLVDSHPEGRLHRRVLRAGGLRIGGLGGIFSDTVWYPSEGTESPIVRTRLELARQAPRRKRWRRGPPILKQGFILPEDVAAVQQLKADILVTHEAPTSHRRGFSVLDKIARGIGARWVVHPSPRSR